MALQSKQTPQEVWKERSFLSHGAPKHERSCVLVLRPKILLTSPIRERKRAPWPERRCESARRSTELRGTVHCSDRGFAEQAPRLAGERGLRPFAGWRRRRREPVFHPWNCSQFLGNGVLVEWMRWNEWLERRTGQPFQYAPVTTVPVTITPQWVLISEFFCLPALSQRTFQICNKPSFHACTI